MKRITWMLGAATTLGAILAGGPGCVENPPNALIPEETAPPPSDETSQGATSGDPAEPNPVENEYAGGPENTFNHSAGLGEDGARDPFEVLKERQEEGPPEIRTRLHSCQKVQYATVRNILEAFNVDIDAMGDPPRAGQLWKGGAGALGAPNYDARVGETLVWSASGAAKLFDIFVQAAPEIIANIESVPQCQVGGVGVPMFDAQAHCNSDAVSCLIGRPATAEHIAVCNSAVESGSELETGKRVAVATLLSAAHSCE